MPTITPTYDSISPTARVVTWAGLATGDTINPITPAHARPAIGTVTMEGTWGGSTVVLEGSNDGTNYFTLKNPQGTAISATGDALFEVSTAALYIRPGSSAGSGDSVNVILAMRG